MSPGPAPGAVFALAGAGDAAPGQPAGVVPRPGVPGFAAIAGGGEAGAGGCARDGRRSAGNPRAQPRGFRIG